MTNDKKKGKRKMVGRPFKTVSDEIYYLCKEMLRLGATKQSIYDRLGWSTDKGYRFFRDREEHEARKARVEKKIEQGKQD